MYLEVNDSDIRYAEKILFRKTKVFDKERVEFIKNLDTIDLQAVPGSGKTTALLAKLLILERKLGFSDNSGILVISHTNIAVEEIKNRIGKYAPKLFKYPNFIGTIQSFIDQFLAIPYYKLIFRKSPSVIDDEIYRYYIEDFWSNTQNFALKSFIEKRSNPIEYLLSVKFKNLLTEIEAKGLKNKTTKTYRALLKMKQNLLESGILNFHDTYILANLYIEKFPRIKRILQKRFKFVFVDEMQDMNKDLYDLLESLFFKKHTIGHVYQRIGDINQSIYDEKGFPDELIWRSGNRKVLKLKGSHRLSPFNSKVVENFAIKSTQIEGRNQDVGIKPHLIIYNDNNKECVIPKFVELIKYFQAGNLIPDNSVYPIKIIGWRKESDNENTLTISKYWPDFQPSSTRKKIDYSSLHSYITAVDTFKKLFDEIRKNLLNALLKILRIENIKYDNDSYFTERKLLKLLRENFPEEYEKFKLNVYKICSYIIDDNIREAKNLFKENLNFVLKEVFNQERFSKKTEEFLSNNKELREQITEGKGLNKNIINIDGITLHIGTVHSVKGETHTATLYLETEYQRSTDIKRILPCFYNINVDNVRKKGNVYSQSLRMSYVGFSRPTHFLCVAVNENSLDRNPQKRNEIKEKMKQSGWVIINI
ncbi:UvrD-helicase domain-containing protein [Persephonella sp.]